MTDQGKYTAYLKGERKYFEKGCEKIRKYFRKTHSDNKKRKNQGRNGLKNAGPKLKIEQVKSTLE
jgi:hypothetical protein